MAEWLSNPWAIAVGAGTLSGLLVDLVTSRVFSRKDERWYNQKIESANRENVYSLRPGISEGHVAHRRVVECLISATARKYSVVETELLDPAQIVEELMKEIMDSSFISSQVKSNYCDQLEARILAPIEQETDPLPTPGHQVELRPEQREYRSRLISMASAILGAIAALTTTVVLLDNGSTLENPLLPVLAGAVAATLASMAALAQKARRRGHLGTTDVERKSRDS